MDVVNSSKIIYLVVGASRHTYIAVWGKSKAWRDILFVKSQNKHTHVGR